eukprot:10035178-Alexandrium_andersonii.AAC.1
MSASLVGSEMCIRDRGTEGLVLAGCIELICGADLIPERADAPKPARAAPVSYTHLTLPTICSV